MRKCWNCGQPTTDNDLRVCSDDICQRAEKKSSNGEFKHRGVMRQHERQREYEQRPERRAKKYEYQREYRQRPEYKAKRRERYLHKKKLREEE